MAPPYLYPRFLAPPVFLALMLPALGCSSESKIFCEPSSSAGDIGGSDAFDNRFFRDDAAARAMTICSGQHDASDITASGAFNANVKDTTLAIEAQRDAWDVIAAAVQLGDAEMASSGLRAIEWSFSPEIAGPDGSWPTERGGDKSKQSNLHPKSIFLYAAARALRLLRGSTLAPDFASRTDSLLPLVARSAQWMSASPDTAAFLGSNTQVNQLLFVVTAIQESAVLIDDATLAESTAPLLDQVLAKQGSDGTLPEKDGFDSSYQVVSIELLTKYISNVSDPERAQALMPSLDRAVDRFVAVVSPNGQIDTQANTRTEACGDPIPGPGPKGTDIDIIPLRLRYAGKLLGESSTLDPLADAIETVGQGFDHIGTCTGF